MNNNKNKLILGNRSLIEVTSYDKIFVKTQEPITMYRKKKSTTVYKLREE